MSGISSAASSQNLNINYDVDPLIPEGSEFFHEDQFGLETRGNVEFSFNKISFFLTDKQKNERGDCGVGIVEELVLKIIEGELLKSSPRVIVLTAHVLDFYLTHKHLIPNELKGKAIFFFGTKFRHFSGTFKVRYLFWNGIDWDQSDRFLDGNWYDSDLIAIYEHE